MTVEQMRYPTIDVLKSEAGALRQSLERDGAPVSHSKSLELLARWYGARDWNTLCALAKRQAPRLPGVGERTRGCYLGQPFEGEVIGLQKLAGGKNRITIRFDEPVDVVTFESFSSFRSRVTATVGAGGESPARTGTGEPQLRLELQ